MGGRLSTLFRSVWRWLTGSGHPKDMPGWVFVTQILWALGLLAVFLAFVHGNDRLDLPHAFGKVPVEAPWLGAVGGLLASLGGIAYFSRDRWEPRFNYWHPIKPLTGAVSGAVACLLVIVLVRTAAGSTPNTLDTTALDAAAFVFGFAEKSFRELIKGVTDVFLKPGTKPKNPPGTAEIRTGNMPAANQLTQPQIQPAGAQVAPKPPPRETPPSSEPEPLDDGTRSR
jgi:hypothetical protein